MQLDCRINVDVFYYTAHTCGAKRLGIVRHNTGALQTQCAESITAHYHLLLYSHGLVSQQRLINGHLEDKLRGLSDGSCNEITIHFIAAIFDLARLCRLRQRLASSAAVYFHRFYLRSCFCRADPRLVFVGCLYLASKAEESALAAKHMVTYAKKLRPGWVYDMKHLLDIEMVIIEELDFDLVVFSPYQQLCSFARDAAVGEACGQRAYGILNDSYRTKVCLTHAPRTIAVACLQLALSFETPAAAEEGEQSSPKWIDSVDVDLPAVMHVGNQLTEIYGRNGSVLGIEECERILELLLSH